MRTAQILVITVALFLCGKISYAMTVSDPTSYTYYAQQLQQMTKQMGELQKQVQKQIETINELKTVQAQMKGAYNTATGVLSNISRLKSIAEKTPSTIKQQGDKWHDVLTDGSGMVNPGDYLEKVFADPRTARNDGSLYTRLDKIYGTRQAALRTSIEESDKLLQGIAARYQRIADLAARIDATENIKAAQDLTNAILVELLTAFTDFMALDARFKEARSMFDYSGITDDAQSKQLDALGNTAVKSTKGDDWQKKQLNGNQPSARFAEDIFN